MEYKVSIIVPIYNGERFIDSCWSALINQTLKDIEIIFVDDGSTDNSKKKLEKLKDKHQNVLVFHQENSGPSAARKIGIEISRGEYIGFVDIDDFPLPEMYEKLYSNIVINGADMAVCGLKEERQNGSINEINVEFPTGKVLKRDEIKNKILKQIIRNGGGIYASMCNKIYKRSWIKENKINITTNRNYGEDWFFNQLALGRAEKITFVQEALYCYRRCNPESITLKYRKDLFRLHIESRKYMEQRMIEWRLNELEDRINADTRFSEKVFEVMNNIMHEQNKINYFKKYCLIKAVVNQVEVQQGIKHSKNNLFTISLKNRLYFIIFLYSWYRGFLKAKMHKAKKLIKRKVLS